MLRPVALLCLCLMAVQPRAFSQTVEQKSTPAPAAMPAPVPLPPVSEHDSKEAEKHFKRGLKLFKKGNLDAAELEYTAAARLNPGNTTYIEERELTRTKIVNELLADASHARQANDHVSVAEDLSKARRLDPSNSLVTEQINAEAAAIDPVVLPTGNLSKIDSGIIVLQPTPGKQPLHFRGAGQQLVRQVFERFGIKVTIDDSVLDQQIRAETEDLDFQKSADTAMLLTNSFYVALDPHRVLVAKDTKENRAKFERQFVETIYLPGLTQTELQDAFNIIRQIMNVTQASQNKDRGTLTMRGSEQALKTVNNVLTDLYQGHSQVLLTLTLYQVTRTNMHSMGVVLPNQFTMFNVSASEASLFSQYGPLIEELIAEGLVSANNPLEILAALIASGELTNSVFNQGFFLFGGGLTQFGVGFGAGTANVQLNSSDLRQLDKIQLRVGNAETATFRLGTRYPIITASYTAAGISTTATSSGLNILQLMNQNNANLSAAAATPNIQYQDLGLTLKAVPMVQKSGDISMKLELQMSALAGTSLNSVPVLANRELKTITVKEGESSMITSNLNRQESKALIGIPGINDIPGFPATNADNSLSVQELVMVLTPHVVRLEHPNGVGQMMIVPLH